MSIHEAMGRAEDRMERTRCIYAAMNTALNAMKVAHGELLSIGADSSAYDWSIVIEDAEHAAARIVGVASVSVMTTKRESDGPTMESIESALSTPRVLNKHDLLPFSAASVRQALSTYPGCIPWSVDADEGSVTVRAVNSECLGDCYHLASMADVPMCAAFIRKRIDDYQHGMTKDLEARESVHDHRAQDRSLTASEQDRNGGEASGPSPLDVGVVAVAEKPDIRRIYTDLREAAEAAEVFGEAFFEPSDYMESVGVETANPTFALEVDYLKPIVLRGMPMESESPWPTALQILAGVEEAYMVIDGYCVRGTQRHEMAVKFLGEAKAFARRGDHWSLKHGDQKLKAAWQVMVPI